MASTPLPPRPPEPPVPPRSGSPILAIVLLGLGLIILVCFLTLWVGVRFLSRSLRVQVDESKGGGKEVSISTPVGSLNVRKDVSEAQLGLPIYPGATRIKDEDSASVNLDFGGEENVRIAAAKYETPDALDKVVSFYRSRLDKEITRFVEKNQEGKTVIEIKHDKQEKVVAIKDFFGRTRIDLVRVTHGQSEAN